MLQKIVSCFIILSLGGCCGSQVMKFPDGNYYYPNWCNYDHCYPNIARGHAQCFKDGEVVATIYPLSQSDLAEIRYRDQFKQQRSQQESAEFNQGLQNLSNTLQRQNEQNNYNFQQFMNRENVYKVRGVGPYGY